MYLKVYNNNDDNKNIKDINFQYSGKYGIKELFLKRIKMDPINTKIESLNDLSNLMIAYARNVPYDSSDIIYGQIKNINVEYSIQRVLFENKGTNCIPLNLLFGTFLFEMGIDVKLVKSINDGKQINKWFQYHMANIILWNDGNLYFIDCGLCAITPYKPIELGNSKLIYNDRNLKRGFRVRQLSSNTHNEYFYEYIQNGNSYIVFHFTLDPVNFESFEISKFGYRRSGIENLKIFKLFKYGHYYLFPTLFLTQYHQRKLNKCKHNDCCISEKNHCLKVSYPIFSNSIKKIKILNSYHFDIVSKSIFYKRNYTVSNL